jgi:hypothetical protein
MIDGFYESLLTRIRENLSDYSKCCLDGSLKTLEDYKYANGVIRGLELAEDIARETFNLWLNGSYTNKDVGKGAKKFELYSS